MLENCLGILAHILTWSLLCEPTEATAALPKVHLVLNETLVEYRSPVLRLSWV